VRTIHGEDTRLAKGFVKKTLILNVVTNVSCRCPFIFVQKKAMACSTLCLPHVINIQQAAGIEQ
jgi:hypothetical protein